MTEDGKPLKNVTVKSGKLYCKPIDNPNNTSDEWVEIPTKNASINGMSINFEAPGIWFDESHSMMDEGSGMSFTKLSDLNQALKKMKKSVDETTEAVEHFYVQYHNTPYHYGADIKLKPTTYPLW